MNLDTIQQDIASLPPDAQQIIVELVKVLKKRYLLNHRNPQKIPCKTGLVRLYRLHRS
jgi:mRNA-degrading endonuclease RelE of RelBE toxin-antitoxin system